MEGSPAIKFGTDGIRGAVGSFPITPAAFERVGQACCEWLLKQNLPLSVAIGWDTRASGKDLADAFARGFCSKDSAEVIFLRITPTPAISFYVEHQAISLGVSITASHNPYTDNGLKLFKASGSKLSRSEEAEIERLCLDKKPLNNKISHKQIVDGCDYYLQAFKQKYSQNLFKGKKIILDVANGATYHTTLPLLQYLGFDIVSLGDCPNGININENCGSEHADHLADIVKAQHAWLGFAHDGDGDRIVVIDENGERLEGDELLGLLAIDLKQQGQLANDTIVVTEQSNSGLKKSLEAFGITVKTCSIGDREVYYGLEQHKANFGGESSGHIIFKDEAPTGDGLRVLLKLLFLAGEKPLCERKKFIHLLPKCEGALIVKEKIPLEQLVHLNKLLAELKSASGRSYVRYSGTENKLRFLVEADTKTLCEERMKILQQAAILDLG